MILATSRAPISRIFVAQRIADGASYSSVVSAKAACVLDTTSKPSRFNASPSRFAKYTLLSISRTFAGRPAGITVAPPLLATPRLAHGIALGRVSAYPDSKPRLHLRHATATRRHAARRILLPPSFPHLSAHTHPCPASRSTHAVFRSCALRSSKSGARSDVFREASPKRRTREQSGHAAGSRLPASAFGEEIEKHGWEQRVQQSGSRKRQTASRPAVAGRTIAVRVRPIPSLRGVRLLESCFYGIVRLQKSRIEQSQFFRRQKAFRTHHWHDRLVEGRQPPVPLPLFVTEGEWQCLQARHGCHLVNAVDQEGRARFAQHE